jgi:hypothetical protein
MRDPIDSNHQVPRKPFMPTITLIKMSLGDLASPVFIESILTKDPGESLDFFFARLDASFDLVHDMDRITVPVTEDFDSDVVRMVKYSSEAIRAVIELRLAVGSVDTREALDILVPCFVVFRSLQNQILPSALVNYLSAICNVNGFAVSQHKLRQWEDTDDIQWFLQECVSSSENNFARGIRMAIEGFNNRFANPTDFFGIDDHGEYL